MEVQCKALVIVGLGNQTETAVRKDPFSILAPAAAELGKCPAVSFQATFLGFDGLHLHVIPQP
jgi:hypothetical protein